MMNKKNKKSKNTGAVILRAGILIIILLIAMIIYITGCTTSEGRNIGGTIWGNSRSANNPDRGIGNGMLSFDGSNIFAITKSDGYFSVTGIPEGNYTLSLTKYGEEIFTGSTSVVRTVTETEQRMAMSRSSEFVLLFEFPKGTPGLDNFSGTIIDENDEPVVGAEIDLIYKTDGYFNVTETDHAGSFYFTDIMPFADLLIIDADGYVPLKFDMEQIAAGMLHGTAGAQFNIVRLMRDEPISPASAGTITGVVTDQSGNALPGITVARFIDDPEIDPIMSNATILETDETGKYTFENIDAGDYVIWVGHPNYFPDQKSVTVEENTVKTLNITLDAATETKTHPFFDVELNP